MAAWKLWIILGLVLAVAELLFLPARFLLVALGVCALLVGLLSWGSDLSIQAQLYWFAGLAVVLVPVWAHARRRALAVRDGGRSGEAPNAPQQATVIGLAPLAVSLHGDRFLAETDETEPFEIGEKVLVLRLAGITAVVGKPRREDPAR